MPLLIAFLLFLLGLAFLLGWFVSADPKKLANWLRSPMLKVAALGVGLAMFLLLATRLGPGALLWLGAMALPLIMNLRGILRRAKSMAGPSEGKSSEIETRFLRMTLDHDTGEMRGVVREGLYRGKAVEQLPRAALMELLAECRVADPQSAQVLEAYLDRAEPNWRDAEADDHAENAGTSESRWGRGPNDPRAAAGGMTRQEAYRVLGLAPGADEASIRAAHRNLMRDVHPDRGGDPAWAARINQARDVLLAT